MRKTITLLLIALLVGTGMATTGHLIDLKCPLCGTATQGTELFSTNNAGGADRDLLERAGGGQPVLLRTVTCPKCHYSADEGEFEKAVAPALAEAVRAGTFKLPAFKRYPDRHATEGLRAKDQPPAWVSHALIAQQMRFAKAPASEVSHRDMMVIWSMRFEANPFADHASEEGWKLLREATPLTPPESQNRADGEVAMGRYGVANLEKFPAEKRELVAGAAAYLLRSHGENEDLLRFLDRYQPTGPMADNWRSVAQEAREAIALERTYQEIALGSLREAAVGEDAGLLTYLTAELLRRMGRSEEARAAYTAAAGMKDMPEWLLDWIKAQEKLLP